MNHFMSSIDRVKFEKKEIMEALKFEFFIFSILFFAKFLPGQGFLASLKDTYWTPSGCVACIKSADKRFFKSLILLKPECAEAKEKYTEFKALGTTSYMFNICKENNKEEFQSRLKTMKSKAKEILHSFEKCARKTLDFGEKSAIKDSWEEFETERGKCEDTEHLSKEIKHFWEKLPYTGVMEAVWGITPENVEFVGSLIA